MSEQHPQDSGQADERQVKRCLNCAMDITNDVFFHYWCRNCAVVAARIITHLRPSMSIGEAMLLLACTRYPRILTSKGPANDE